MAEQKYFNGEVAVLFAPGLKSSEKLVLLYVSWRQGQKVTAYPSMAKISRDLKMPESVVVRAILALEKKSLLKISRGSRGQVNHYSVPESTPDSSVLLRPNEERSTPDSSVEAHRIRVSSTPDSSVEAHLIQVSNPDKNPDKNPDIEPKQAHAARRRVKRVPVTVKDFDLPLALNTPEFIAALKAWIEYRAERRQPIMRTGISMLTRRFVELGHDGAISAIEFSISQGYQGLFPARQNSAPLPAVAPFSRALTKEESVAVCARLDGLAREPDLPDDEYIRRVLATYLTPEQVGGLIRRGLRKQSVDYALTKLWLGYRGDKAAGFLMKELTGNGKAV